MSSIFSMLLAIAAGAMLPAQAAINARLGRTVGSPVWAAAISGLVLTLALTVVAGWLVRGGPRFSGVGSLPWWAWVGGLCGALTLAATTVVAPKLGTAGTIALVMAGQVVVSLLLDYFGLLGLPVHPVGGKQLLAAALLLAGAALMR